jgi:hypothetical protein
MLGASTAELEAELQVFGYIKRLGYPLLSYAESLFISHPIDLRGRPKGVPS